MRLFRIADRRYPIWDGSGAALVGGRWNSSGNAVIYAATSHACALLEVLVHAGIGEIPLTHGIVVADVPESLAVERVEGERLPVSWSDPDSVAARTLGDAWLASRRTALLLLPSVVARYDWNALVNPSHPDSTRIKILATEPVLWDTRLFRRSQSPA